MFGIPFRKAILILLAAWTVVFVLIQLISVPPLIEKEKPSVEPTKVSTSVIEEPFPKQLSFILLNWNRTDCVRTVVKHAQIYNQFITEIVIGNNNPRVNLLSEDFESPNIPLRVVNFPQNRYFYARYELCLMSKGLYCYMQDDDWDNKYVRSLYANFLRYPHLLHTTTNAFVHFLSWSWTFFEPDINLHTGFSWLGTGAIASKDNVERFIYSQCNLISREHLIYADMYFATWFNQVPYQLQNDLFELDLTQTGFSNEKGGISRNKLHMTKGIQILYKQLTLESKLLPVAEQHPHVEEYYTKSPCFKDDCLFMTSVHSFPSPTNFIYDPQTDIEEVEVRHRKVVNPDTFVEFPYNFAVDDSLDTSWKALFEIQDGDFFGLDIFEPLEKQIIYLKVGHEYQGDLALEVSLDGSSWTSDGCTWNTDYKTIDMAYFYRYSLISDCTCKFRFIRFKSGGHYESPFQVFDIGFEDKLNVWDKETEDIKRSDACSIAVQSIKPKAIVPKTRLSLALLPEIGNGEIPVTFVVLNWKRTHNFPHIFDLIGQYSFVNEYIIWNNNKDKVLDMSMLFPKNPPPAHVNVRIINSPQNLHDYAKYLSCSMATNEYCYFQDDDWLNIYFRSQYTSFLRHPHLFHSMTIPIIYLEHRRWNIFDSSVGLHAGFSWLGVGSFTSKARVQRFLNQCSLFNLNQDELLQADLFFSYFNNDYPVELTTVASQLDQSGAWSTSVDQWSIVYRRLQLSSGKVHNYLKRGNNGTVIPNTKPAPAYENRDIRSPCHTDNCLFITNSYPFPYPQQVPFDPSRTIKEQEAEYNSLDWPSNWFWMFNSYDRAVDEDVYTPWTSYNVSKRGDYFGLDLLTHKLHQKFTVVLDHDISNYQIKISSDAGTWTNVEYTVEMSYLIGGPLELYIISLDYEKPFRLISFTLIKGKLVEGNQIMSVYEVSEGSPFSASSLSSNKVANPSFEDWTKDWNLEYPERVDIYRLQDEHGEVAVTGSRSLAFSSAVAGVKFAASQEIVLDQTSPRSVVVSVFSKAEKVKNMDYPGPGYSVTAHLSFANGATEWAAATYVFNPGTHGWQARVFRVKPDSPLRAITVQVLFQNHVGTVQFDDVTVQEIL